ncbi:hypothetical protein BC629DRAFT_1597345 [Irpex lacteus]|nr:hypothetical protein BC629DRAFT_1597345 [Irpex lacteus]
MTAMIEHPPGSQMVLRSNSSWCDMEATSPSVVYPHPALPPLPRYNFDNLTAQEAERLLVKAHSLQRNWQSDDAVPGLRSFDFDYCIAEIALLPGGRYLVASISDPTKQNWGIILCSLDLRSGVTLIAKISTKAKAFQSQARYLNVRGEAGITIAFIYRDWVHKAVFLNSTPQFDSIHGEYRMLRIPLSSISLVPGSVQKAWTCPLPSPIILIKSHSHILGPLVLDDFHGEPYLTLAQDPSQIIFKPLNDSDGPVSVIGLIPQDQYPDAEYRSEAIRPFPQQNQILVARSIQCEPKPLLCFEMHAIPRHYL